MSYRQIHEVVYTRYLGWLQSVVYDAGFDQWHLDDEFAGSHKEKFSSLTREVLGLVEIASKVDDKHSSLQWQSRILDRLHAMDVLGGFERETELTFTLDQYETCLFEFASFAYLFDLELFASILDVLAALHSCNDSRLSDMYHEEIRLTEIYHQTYDTDLLWELLALRTKIIESGAFRFDFSFYERIPTIIEDLTTCSTRPHYPLVEQKSELIDVVVEQDIWGGHAVEVIIQPGGNSYEVDEKYRLLRTDKGCVCDYQDGGWVCVKNQKFFREQK